MIVALFAASMLGAACVVARGGSPMGRIRMARGLDLVPSDLVARLVRRSLAFVGRGGDDAAAVGALVESWSGQLRAGRPVDAALADAFDDLVVARRLLPRTVAAGAIGGDVGAALRLDAITVRGPTARRALQSAAACWSAAQENGGRMADALDRLGDSVRSEQRHAAHVRAQLAGPRATARLLAALPCFALVLGSSLGLRPWDVLVGDRIGRAALVGGVLLDVVGLVWTERMAVAAERAG